MTNKVVRPARAIIIDLLEYAESHQDEGPEGRGWQSEKLKALIAEATEFITIRCPTCQEPVRFDLPFLMCDNCKRVVGTTDVRAIE